MAGGALLGALAAVAFDGTFLARRKKRVERGRDPSGVLHVGSISASPALGATSRGGLTAGLQGIF